MSQHREYRQLMEEIRTAHETFRKSWREARTAAMKIISPDGRTPSWEQVWQANGIAYKQARPLEDRRNQLLRVLFEEHIGPLHDDFLNGDPAAINTIIDFLEVDVPAFRCGYAKEDFLRKLKALPLTNEHQSRLRSYCLHLCGTPAYRREIAQVGRLMVRVADRAFVDQLQQLTINPSDRIGKKSARMLTVIQNGRKDLC
jgi:hypothetical protein